MMLHVELTVASITHQPGGQHVWHFWQLDIISRTNANNMELLFLIWSLYINLITAIVKIIDSLFKILLATRADIYTSYFSSINISSNSLMKRTPEFQEDNQYSIGTSSAFVTELRFLW